MRPKGIFLLICGMLGFIFVHTFISDFISRLNFVESVIPIVGGFSPSITHDSVSTRNPALEAFFAILSDLPGAYSFYFSPIMLAPPEISNGEVNGQTLPQLIDVRNPTATTLTVLQAQQTILLLISGIVIVIGIFWGLGRYWRHRRSRMEWG